MILLVVEGVSETGSGARREAYLRHVSAQQRKLDSRRRERKRDRDGEKETERGERETERGRYRAVLRAAMWPRT